MTTGEVIALIKAFGGGSGGGGSSGGGVLVVHDVEGTLDKTWQEIFDADFAVIKTSPNENEWKMHYINTVDVYDGVYELDTKDDERYAATSASGYPSFTE